MGQEPEECTARTHAMGVAQHITAGMEVDRGQAVNAPVRPLRCIHALVAAATGKASAGSGSPRGVKADLPSSAPSHECSLPPRA